jgi:hypothetical protein
LNFELLCLGSLMTNGYHPGDKAWAVTLLYQRLTVLTHAILLAGAKRDRSHTCLSVLFKNSRENLSSIPLLETVNGWFSSVPP